MDTVHRILIATPVVCSILSCILYVPTLPKNPKAEGRIRLPIDTQPVNTQGRIRLPTDSDEANEDHQVPDEVVYEKSFDVSDADGYPVKGGEDRFWKAVSESPFSYVRTTSTHL
jgi:hypothetical protein